MTATLLVTLSQIAEAIVLGGGFLMMAIAGVWMVGEDLGPDVDVTREERRKHGGVA